MGLYALLISTLHRGPTRKVKPDKRTRDLRGDEPMDRNDMYDGFYGYEGEDGEPED